MLDGIFTKPGLGAMLKDVEYEDWFDALPDGLKRGFLH